MSTPTPPPTTAAQWPGAAVSTDSDLLSPGTRLLEAWQLLPTGGTVRPLKGTPDSIAIIKTGMSAAAKWWSASGLAAAGIPALLAAFNQVPEQLKDAIPWGLPIFSSAVALAIGLVIACDVRSRAAATIAQLEQRGRVVVTYLQTTAALQAPSVATAPPVADPRPSTALTDDLKGALALAMSALPVDGTLTATAGTTSGSLTGVRLDAAEGLQARIGKQGPWVGVSDLTGLVRTRQ